MDFVAVMLKKVPVCKVWGFHSGYDEGSGLPGLLTLSISK